MGDHAGILGAVVFASQLLVFFFFGRKGDLVVSRPWITGSFFFFFNFQQGLGEIRCIGIRKCVVMAIRVSFVVALSKCVVMQLETRCSDH